MTTVDTGEIERICASALINAGASPENAAPVAAAIARAEAEGNSVCGLFYLRIFCEHVRCGKVDGSAVPDVAVSGATVRVDARHGFAHPAIEAGVPRLADAAKSLGVAALAVRNSCNCLALAHHVTPLAERGLIGLCVSNAPASVAPPGATARIFGTNPLAFAVPVADGEVFVVDQSMSAVTKTEMILRKERGEPIPLGWAQDAAGEPTTDAAEGLAGSLLPAGGQKGANIALLIEVLAAALTGSRLSAEASPFGDNEGCPPGVGQFLLAIDPGHFGGGAFAANIARLAASFDYAGARLPGRRTVAEASQWRGVTVEVDAETWRVARELAE